MKRKGKHYSNTKHLKVDDEMKNYKVGDEVLVIVKSFTPLENIDENKWCWGKVKEMRIEEEIVGIDYDTDEWIKEESKPFPWIDIRYYHRGKIHKDSYWYRTEKHWDGGYLQIIKIKK